ncbi:hypothetical protein PV325_006178 [Microctonus aethiopoides]|nr:hypothetical protein PV325_006178 [Microctonus aethiopoides]
MNQQCPPPQKESKLGASPWSAARVGGEACLADSSLLGSASAIASSPQETEEQRRKSSKYGRQTNRSFYRAPPDSSSKLQCSSHSSSLSLAVFVNGTHARHSHTHQHLYPRPSYLALELDSGRNRFPIFGVAAIFQRQVKNNSGIS